MTGLVLRFSNAKSTGWLGPAAACVLILTSCSQSASTVSTAPTAPRSSTAAASNASSENGPHVDNASPIEWTDYAVLLYRVCDGDAIRLNALIRSRPELDRMMDRLAGTGPTLTPELFPDQASRTAYYVNAHNLAAMAELLSIVSIGRAVHRLPADFGEKLRHQIDGRSVSLRILADSALNSSPSDWRVRMALFSARGDGPPLPLRPLLADMLDIQLDEIIRAGLRSERMVRIDHGEVKRLLLHDALFDLRGALIADYERRMRTNGASVLNVLLEWASPADRLTLNSAVGYAVVRMPRLPIVRFTSTIVPVSP